MSLTINGTKIENIKGDRFHFLGSRVFSENQLLEVIVSLNKTDKLPFVVSTKFSYTPLVNVIPKFQFELEVYLLISSALSKPQEVERA